jgi:hypothetical protein
MWNPGDVAARMIDVNSPAGFESFFGELSELLLSFSEPDVTQIGEIAVEYGRVDPRSAAKPRGPSAEFASKRSGVRIP